MKPASQVPIDGVCIEGKSSVDCALVTGESLPVKVEPGKKVIGGTLNKQGAFKMKVTKVGSDTMLMNILKLVEDALSQKPEIQKLVDVVTAYFVPVVMVIAVITFAVWMIIGVSFYYALRNMVTVLVVACPCGMGLATPTAITVGIGVGSQKGILIRNIESL